MADVYHDYFRYSFRNAHTFLSREDRDKADELTRFLKDLFHPELNIIKKKKAENSAPTGDPRTDETDRAGAIGNDDSGTGGPAGNIGKQFSLQIPVLFRADDLDVSCSFSSSKIVPKRASTNAAEGLMGLNRKSHSTYISTGQYAYTASGRYDRSRLARCYSMVIDIDSEAGMYSLEKEKRPGYVMEAYPELGGSLAPTYIIATGKKGFQLVYCFLEDVAVSYKRESYMKLQKLLIDYFGADAAHTGMGMIRLPFSERYPGPDDLANGIMIEQPYILWHNEEGPVHYSEFCGNVSSFFMKEGMISAPVAPYKRYEEYMAMRKRHGRTGEKRKVPGPVPAARKAAIRLHNSNRVSDIEALVKMRGGGMTGMRDNTVYIYACAVASVCHDPDMIAADVKSLNDGFAEPLPRREVDSVIRSVLAHKDRYGFAKNISDARMADILNISGSEMQILKNCYTCEQKKERRRKNASKHLTVTGKRGRRSNLNRYIGIMAKARRTASDNSTAVKQAVKRNGVPRSRAYALLKLLDRLYESARTGSTVLPEDPHTGHSDRTQYDMMFAAISSGTGLTVSGTVALGDIIWHMLCGDSLQWERSADGMSSWKILMSPDGDMFMSPGYDGAVDDPDSLDGYESLMQALSQDGEDTAGYGFEGGEDDLTRDGDTAGFLRLPHGLSDEVCGMPLPFSDDDAGMRTDSDEGLPF